MSSQSFGVPANPLEKDTEALERRPRRGTGLCLSGGGYRAMLFHLGALWRLNELGYLPKLDRVSSVSGGSITAGVLGLAWKRLAFDANGVSPRFGEAVVTPLRTLAGVTIDVPSVLKGILWRGNASDHVAAAYRTHLFGDHTLQDLPDDAEGPRFIFNAANLQSGVLCRFSKPYIQDYRVGRYDRPAVDLAIAVAASSAFPPVLSPTILKVKRGTFEPAEGADLNRPPFTTRLHLTDGGVYDNLGLETVWKNYETVLVSNGGGKLEPGEKVGWDYLRHTMRVLNVIDNQVRSLRVRQLIDSYRLPEGSPDRRLGTYWGMRINLADYDAGGKLPVTVEQGLALARTPTRLAKLDPGQQERIINWGYAACDAAMRSYVDRALPPPTGFPYPGAGVGS